MTITEFLAARLDEDEWIARGAARTDDGHAGRWLPVHFGAGGFDARVDDHIARHDPARVLREVEADRQLLALHRPEFWNADDDLDDIHCAECMADEDLYKAQIWPCPTVRHLAAVYSDHPDYDPAWSVA